MGLSAPSAESISIISLQSVKKVYVLTQWALVHLGPTLSVLLPWSQFKKILGINPMGLSDPWSDSLDIIALKTVKTIHGLT